MLDRDLLSAEFPLTRDWCYLASASNGILPERSRRYLERYFAEHHYLELGRHYRMFDDLGAIRERAARLFGGQAANWALLPNTSYGLNSVAAAIDWRAGDNVVLADCEFPANVAPWQNLARRGVAIQWVAARGLRAQADSLIAACNGRTRALAVSGVQFHNGYAPDLARLAAFCREQRIWLCVDGIQGLGNRHWQLPELGVDFLAAGGQKWLCAPRGTGLLYLSDRALGALRRASVEAGPSRLAEYRGVEVHGPAQLHAAAQPGRPAPGGGHLRLPRPHLPGALAGAARIAGARRRGRAWRRPARTPAGRPRRRGLAGAGGSLQRLLHR